MHKTEKHIILNAMNDSDTSTHERPAFKTSDAQKGRVKPKAKLCPDVTTELPITIVGAGLTGLACALVFSDLSMKSVILESRSNQDLISGGMGINLQQKAIECLNELGISTESLVNKGNIILKQSYYCTDGRHVCSLDKSANSKRTSNEYGQIAIHRGKVLELLLEKVSEKTNVEILNNRRVVDVKNLDKTVSIETKTGRENYTQRFSSSLTLGADGINSKVRERLFANTSNKKSPVVYHGITHYRGIAHDFPTFLDGNTMVIIGGTETKFVIYPITSAHEGKQSINWVAAVKEKNVNNSLRQEQVQKHILNILRSDKFHVDFLDFFALVKKTDSIKAWPMIDLEPLDCWIDGRVALIGDAAHAMLPVGSGGAMAGFLDALAMKEAFQKSGPVPVQNVIKLFQVMRYSGASKLQKKCRFQPAEKIVQEVMDQTQLKDVPSSYSDRICNAMKKIQSPTPDNSCNSSNLMQKRALIVGAGASGIATCKEFLENGFEPIVFEAGSTFGGVFRDAYEKLQLTTSSAYTAFSDYPAQEQVPTMWSSKEYLSYLHNYATDNNVFPHIQFDSIVLGVKRLYNESIDTESSHDPNITEKYLWEVAVLNSVAGTITRIRSRILIFCVGSNAKPNIPRFSKQDTYKGIIVHTSAVDSFKIFRGKRVLCLGIGESGSDVPYWIAQQPGTNVSIAVRGMGWCVPRRRPLKSGLPTDLNTNRLLWGLPRCLNRVISFLLAYLDSRFDSDPVIRNMGLLNLKHPAGVYKSYGTKSINFLAAIEHLGVKFIQSSISAIGSDYKVEFEDGSSGEFDIVLLNTGYQQSSFEGFCFDRNSMEEEFDATLFQILQEASYTRNLYKRVVHPAIENLYFIGFARPGFAPIPVIAETQARWVAAVASGNCPGLPTEDNMIRCIAEEKARDEAQFDGSASRIGLLVDYLPYVSDIASLLETTPPYLKYLFTDPFFFLRLFVGPATVAQFRLRGPNAKPSIARTTIESYPMPLKRRLHAISLGLYILSLLILLASVAIPMTSKARKALFPVGFPPLQRGTFYHIRYFIGCFHILALGIVYASVFGTPLIGYATIFVIGCMELNVIIAQKKNEKVTRALLTTRKETLTESSINMTQKRVHTNSNKKRATRIPFSSTVFMTMITLSCFDKAYVDAFQNQVQQQNINGKIYKQQGFLSTKLDSRHSDCLKKIKDLEPLARVGLTTAGQLQKLFSTYYNKTVKVAVHRFEKVENDSSNVDNRTETSSKDSDFNSLAVFEREVAISIGDITFCIAKSKIHVYSPEILEHFISKPIGIGQIFELYDVRPIFTLHDVGRNKDGGVWRTYTLKCDILSCEILEDFVNDAWNLDLNSSEND